MDIRCPACNKKLLELDWGKISVKCKCGRIVYVDKKPEGVLILS
jgi:phage FluMu protein Com